MKTPTVEQLQAWTQQWDEAKRFHSIQKELDRQQAKAQDHQAQSIPKALGFEVVAGEQIATLRNELDRALRDLGLEPPWSARNSTSGLYRTDEHVIPLAIRMLDGLRLSKASGYIDFAESDHLYGYKSPFADSHLAVNTGLKDKIKNYSEENQDWVYKQALAKRVEMTEYVGELTSRLLDLNIDIMKTPAEKQDDIKNSIHKDVSTLMERTAGDTLATVDENMTEKTTSLVDRLRVNYFSTRSDGLTDQDNVALQTRTRSKIEQVFKRFNQEKNAERHLSNCFDLAFCAKASESDQSAAHLQVLKDNGVTDIPGVLRGTSVNSAQSLYAFDALDQQELIEKAKHAVKISSYGLLKATIDVMNARNEHIAANDWIDMTKDALIGCEPSIIKQCLHIKDESGKSQFDYCTEEVKHNLLSEAVSADDERSTRSGTDRLQMLLDAGANINARCKHGETVLALPTGSGREKMACRLIQAGADIHVRDASGGTMIRRALLSSNTGMVKLLINEGANIEARGYRGRTALMCASGGDQWLQVVSVPIVEQLIEAGADINAKDIYGITALMLACRNGRGGHETVVLKLIEAGADINAEDHNGWTALMEACLEGHAAVVLKLIEAGADINAKDHSGYTALMHAIATGHETVVLKLIEAGAKVDLKDNNDKTALDYAKDSKNPVIIEFVTQHIARRRENRLMASEDMLTTAGQAQTEGVSTATNATSQALTELTTAATEIGRQVGYGPSL